MASVRVATADDAFEGALASLAKVRQDEVGRARDAQARFLRLLKRGRAACLQDCGAAELRAWAEDVAAELASLGLCAAAEEPPAAGRDEPSVEDLSMSGTLETVRLTPQAASTGAASAGAGTPGAAGASAVTPREKEQAWPPAEASIADLSLFGTLETLQLPPQAASKGAASEGAGAPGAAGACAAAAPAVAPGKKEQAWPPAEASVEVADLAGSIWQWEHRTGFRSYTKAESERIEEAWRSGESKVRLKAGKTGKIPMEIFFADMVQLDPTSGSERSVRRMGGESLFGRLERNSRRAWKSIHNGQLRWETLKQYKKRQAKQRQQEKTSVIDPSMMMVDKSQIFSQTQFGHEHATTRRARIGLWCGRLVQALWWNVLTWLVTAVNVFWIYWTAEHYESTLVFWRPAGVICLDFSFLLFFLTELIIRLLSYKDAVAALQSKLFLRDAWVVVLTFVEVLLFPMVFLVSGTHEVDPGSAWFAFALLVRLSRLVRVERLFRIFPQASTIGKAIASGLESAAIVILMMMGFLFGFAVMLKTGVIDQAVKEKYFSNMSRTLETVVVQGLFFDGVLDYLQDCRDDNVGYWGMLLFICVGQYIFLNMLIGVFSSVAADATSEQVDRRATAYLENNLASILECYLDDVAYTPSGVHLADSLHLGKESFNLILQNLDVLDVLEACGTDIEGLQGMRDVLFPEEKSQISFTEVFQVLLRLRRGKPASVTDVVDLRELTRRRTQELKELILQPAATTSCKRERGVVESQAKRS